MPQYAAASCYLLLVMPQPLPDTSMITGVLIMTYSNVFPCISSVSVHEYVCITYWI